MGVGYSLLRSTDVGVLDDLRPFGDFGLDIAIKRIGRGGVDGHSEIREALSDLRLAHKPRHLRVQPQHDVARSAGRRDQCEPRRCLEAGKPCPL